MKRSNELRSLILAALFAGLDIVCTRLLPAYYLPPGTFLVRVGLQFLVFALAGWTLGPGWAMGAAMVSDVVGVLINPTGTGQFFPGYTLTAGLSGLAYGLILHKRAPAFWRAVLSVAVHMLLIALPLTSLWFQMQGTYPTFQASFRLALLWRAALVLPYALVLTALQKALNRPVGRL
ncbi:MAG: folate family ECF transporter S component [Oscillospiraceae bacterium]|nr:folate family ECF transporter S component [Oscillospiraceae bacterium]